MNIFKTLFLLVFPILLSSAPMVPITREKGIDLKVKFSNPKELKAVGWLGQGPMILEPSLETITLKRQGWGGLPSELIFIPKDNTKQPQIKKIESTTKKVDFESNWQPMDRDKVGFWGRTPPAVCSLFVPLEESTASLSLVTFPKRKAMSTGGFFYIELNKQPKMYVHFSTYHGLFKKIISSDLIEATNIQKLQCRLHYGSDCDVVKQIPSQAFGKTIELKFPKLEKKSVPCPV